MKLPSRAKNVVDHFLPGEKRQDLMEDHPLIMPCRYAPCSAIYLAALIPIYTRVAAVYRIACEEFNYLVVRRQESDLESSDHKIFIVSRISCQRSVPCTWQVLE